VNIQDLGAIGEFVSSIVIVITLIMLFSEIRATKQATQAANAHQRRRARDLTWSLPVEAPRLAETIAKASNHVGYAGLADDARRFGLEPDEMAQLGTTTS